jgi:hypothetical protein
VKKPLTAFLLAVAIFGLLFMSRVDFAGAQTGTQVSGTIKSDTFWTKANSPYNLTGNVFVSEGVTLTVEPGVVVNCNKDIIQVNGTMQVLGSNNDKVVFHTTNRIINSAHEQLANIDFGDESVNCIIENAVLETLGLTYYNCQNTFTLNNNYFKDSTTSTNSGSIRVGPVIRGPGKAIVTNNVFTSRIQLACSASVINNTFDGGGIDAYDGSFTILNNNLTGYPDSPYRDGFGISPGNIQEAVISDNWFSNYVEACIKIDGPALIQRNFIQNVPTGGEFAGYPFFGIEVSGVSPLIQNNTIINCGIGIDAYNQGIEETRPIIAQNNLYSNMDYNLYLGYPPRQGYNPSDYTEKSNIYAADNWWGTGDISSIHETIYDSNHQSSLGTVNIELILTAPNQNAMPNPNAPAPTINQVPAAVYLQATLGNSQNVTIAKEGGLIVYTNARINVTTNSASAQTNITFLVRTSIEAYNFANFTVPKTVILHGNKPRVYFSNKPAEEQGYAEDAYNYFVWCTTQVRDYYGELTIVFSAPVTTPNLTPSLTPIASPTIGEFPAWIILAIIVVTYAVVRISKKRKKI